MTEDNLEHDRWWIDKKISDIERFEQRQLQIIGIVIIVISLLSPKLPPETPIGSISWIVLILCTLVLIGIYLFFSWPRKAKHALGSSKHIKPSEEVYEKYIKELQKSLSKKAKIMQISYIILPIIFIAIFTLLTTG